MNKISLSIATVIIFNMLITNASTSTRSEPNPLKEGHQEISEKNIPQAIGYLNTAQGGLFQAGVENTNAFTQYQDPKSVNRWNKCIDEVDEALNNLLSSKHVTNKTKIILMQKFQS